MGDEGTGDGNGQAMLMEHLMHNDRPMGKNNVNPGQYKVAGRERQGEDVVAVEHKAAKSIKESQLRQQSGRGKKNPERRRTK